MIKAILTGAQKATNAIGKLFLYMGVAILVGMMALTVIDVILRYFFNRPIMGSVEITQVMMVTISFIMLVFCTMRKSHVKVDLFASYIPKRTQRVINSLFYLCCLVMLAIMTWQNFQEAMHLSRVHQETDILEIPIFPFYMVIAVSAGISALLFLLNIFEEFLEEK